MCATAAAQDSNNYQGLWWAAPAGTESGWGVSLAHQGDQVFATWYTYDTSGKPWWISMLAGRTVPSGTAYAGPILQSHGPPFYDFTGSGAATPIGSGTLTFTDANNGNFAYSLNGSERSIAIARYDLGTGPQPTCASSASTQDFAAAANYQDLWWVANGAEPGWGVNIAHQGDTLFATWYTYDVDGTPLWLSALAIRQGLSNVYAGPIYRSSGPRYDRYDAALLQSAQAGAATLTFTDGNHATFAYTMTYTQFPGSISQAKPITRFPLGSPGTVCAAVAPARVKTTTVAVVPLRYEPATGASQAALDAYNASLPKITQAALQTVIGQVSAWYLKTTFGVQNLDIRVLPAVALGPSPGCDSARMFEDAAAAAKSLGWGILVAVAPYGCWSSQASTGGGFVAVWGTVPDGPGLFAHEIGHALGLMHNASMVNGTYVEYGSGYDQMGRGSDFFTLAGLSSDHLERLSALTPLPCASATLRSITRYPDAIRCGDYFVDYVGDWHDQIWVHRREFNFGTKGGSDTTDYAYLSTGQSYSGGGYTFTNMGNGKVIVKGAAR